MKESKDVKEIKAKLRDQEEEEDNSIASKATSIHPLISLKDDNQRSIILAHNPIYHA